MNNFYLVVKSNSANLEIRITVDHDNFIRMQGKANYRDERDNQSVDRSIHLDDPDRNTKLLNLWNTFKTVVSDEMGNIFTEIETQVQDYLQSIET